MPDFQIIESEDKHHVEREVNGYLEHGYKLNGPLYVFHVYTSEEGILHLKYIQSVTIDSD